MARSPRSLATTCVALPLVLLAACATTPDPRFADFPEPHRSSITNELRHHRDSTFSRAFRGDPDALHVFFRRVLDPDLDGGAAESYQFEVMAIRGSLGDPLFFTALSRESPEVERSLQTFAPQLAASRP